MKKGMIIRVKVFAGLALFGLVTFLMLWDVVQHESLGNRESKMAEVLIMVTEPGLKPFEYFENGEIVGFDVDLAREIARDMGRELRIESVASDAVFMNLQSGRADIALGGLTATDERKKHITYSIPYYLSIQKITVQKTSKIKTVEDLKGKRVGVELGSTGDQIAHTIKDAKVVQLPSMSSLMKELSVGKIDAILSDKTPAVRYSAGYKDLKILERDVHFEDYMIAMRKDDLTLHKQVNDSLKKIKDDGRYENIYNKYFVERKDSD